MKFYQILHNSDLILFLPNCINSNFIEFGQILLYFEFDIELNLRDEKWKSFN